MEKSDVQIEITDTEEVKTSGNDELKTDVVQDMEKKLQSELDRVRTKYVKQLKEKDTALENIKKSQMNETEKMQYELSQKNIELESKIKELRNREMKLSLVQKLKDKDLLDLQDFISLPDSEDDLDEKISEVEQKFNSLLQKRLENEIKSNGRTTGVIGNKQNISIAPTTLKEWQKTYLQ